MTDRFSLVPKSEVLKIKVSDFPGKVQNLAADTLESLQVIWEQAGYEDSECQGLLGDIFTKVKALCSAEISAEQQILEHAKETVASKLEHLVGLHGQLGRDSPFDSDSDIHSNNYANQLSTLEKHISEVTAEVGARQGVLDIEIEAIEALCRELGKEKPSDESVFSSCLDTPSLSDARLSCLKECRNNFENAKTSRIEEMKSTAEVCYQFIRDLVVEDEGWITVPESDTYTLCDNAISKLALDGDFVFGIHNDDLSTLNRRAEILEEEKKRRKNELAVTGSEIAHLWTVLRVSQEERDMFSSSFKMNLSMETLSKGREELDRLRQLRIDSLSEVITNIRMEICSLWDEAGIENEEDRRREFQPFFEPMENVGDAALDNHESYFKALKVRVAELKPLLQKVARREGIIRDRMELEMLTLNPDRLMARGPKAREDRKREETLHNRVRLLDKTTRELLAMVEGWEAANNKSFIYCGERYIDRVTAQQNSYTQQRDALRSARKKKDGKMEATPTKSRKGSTSAPSGLVGGMQMSQKLPGRGRKESNMSRGEESLGSLENRPSNGSSTTERTSVTELKERQSTATAIKGSLTIA
jgi:hypothetical protein